MLLESKSTRMNSGWQTYTQKKSNNWGKVVLGVVAVIIIAAVIASFIDLTAQGEQSPSSKIIFNGSEEK